MPTPTLRPAEPDDAPLLVRYIGWAGEGVPELVWASMAEAGETAQSVGLARARREEGSFSYRNSWILEGAGPVGGLVGYPLPTEPVEIGPDFPAPFIPLQELENLAPGHWYVNVLAVEPMERGRGHGSLMLGRAEDIAREAHCNGMAIIAFASNPGAVRLYERVGYTEIARRTFSLDGWPHSGTDAVLLRKDF